MYEVRCVSQFGGTISPYIPTTRYMIEGSKTDPELSFLGDIQLEDKRWRCCYSLLMLAIVLWVYTKKTIAKKILKKEIKTNFLFFDGKSRLLRLVKEGAGSWRSLELIYNYHEKYQGTLKGMERLISDFWFDMENARAVRNRKVYVAKRVSYLISELHEKNEGRRVRIFSIACGSAQAILEGIRDAGKPVDLLLLDVNRAALDYSISLAKDMGVDELVSITTLRRSVTRCGEKITSFKPDIIEMVGLLDYLEDEKVIKIIKEIYNSMPESSYFVTANVYPNREKTFLKWVIDWSMIYRTAEELRDLLCLEWEEFSDLAECEITVDIHGIYGIAVCRKASDSNPIPYNWKTGYVG